MIHLVSRDNPTVLKTSFFRDMDSTQPYRPQDLGFSFSFGTRDKLDPRIGYYTANVVDLSTGLDATSKSIQ